MPNRHRTLTAWLGMLAIWFAIAAPLVSQWRVAQASTPDAIVCSAEHGGHRAHHALHLDACGYCSFFTHTPALGGVTAAPLPTAFLADASAAAPVAVAARVGRYPRAYPRAPPVNA
ncbi:DUF2946 domain-containing protein [Burkholderia stagnalis]|uniref:DUF2946 domain-containing protein n=1 Tax=Burkholderia stagnalis TaxID=1503054 RepID=UPI000F5748A2|nr:DUF2946 domain-containing protein [Burkholderia stagnalis]RQQ52871.1 DUF2946 domain-containing protein [Burkholderia stagnalis]RQY06253.1 DUF2946 domain-containing protein [Burkholderia stagnalis]RQY24475.1 DUF2946 domain-containing protein [Burkholderia stagnalis]RQY37389.1 DUF2946 domain-containing protein [Burkholderia stagnalis]